MGSFVELTAVDGVKIPAYVAKPEGAARGAIVVLQEIFGVNAHIRSVADRYAAQGYVAVAPALFQRVQPNVELGYTEADMKQGFALKGDVESLPAPGVLRDVDAAVAYAAELVSGGKIGVVGFCWKFLVSTRISALSLIGMRPRAMWPWPPPCSSAFSPMWSWAIPRPT